MKNFANKLSAAVAVVFLAAAGCVAAQECYTPLEWIPKNYVTSLDHNKNFVDDEIELMGTSATVDIILCMNACANIDDLERFTEITGTTAVYRSPYLSIMIFEGISIGSAIILGRDKRVAMVELARSPQWHVDISMRAAKLRSSTTYSGTNVEDAFPVLTGAGVNIVIMDSGVDNESTTATGHSFFPASKYVAGYDAVADVETDPDDDIGHGTHVAGIALGTGGTTGTYRGAAPGAGLIDIKIGGAAGIPVTAPFLGYDKIIERRLDWDIKVVNMSFGTNVNVNGTDASSQMVNRIVREGIVVVVAAGNDGPYNVIGEPAAADFAITVANASSLGTVVRTDDDISLSSSRGPRLSDGDGITEDELKPDITAYGRLITSAEYNTTTGTVISSGTSMSAPQVAGLVALILQAHSGMDPLSIKELLEHTAEDFGASGWDVAYGNGIIDAYDAVDEVMTSLQTDLFFTVYCNKPGTTPYWWNSPDVIPLYGSVVEGSTNAVVVTIHNAGPNTAHDVKVRLGIYNFSNSSTDYDICMHTIPVLPPGTYTFSCPWTPEADGLSPSVVHACLKAYIIYSQDTDPSNNCAQHNVQITQTHSPALFNMTVVNPTGEEADMEIITEPSANRIALRGWELTVSESEFTMAADDCPKTVTIGLEAVGINPPPEMPVNVIVRRTTPGGPEIVGGVRIIGKNGNGTPRPPDETVFAGIRHISLGDARLYSTPAALFVSEINGNDGVRARLGHADFWRGTLADFDVDNLAAGSNISFIARGAIGGNPNAMVSQLTLIDAGDHAQSMVDFQATTNTVTTEVYNDGQLVGTDVSNSGVFANIWPSLDNMQITPFRLAGGDVYAEISLTGDTDIELLPSGTDVTGDRIIIRPGAVSPIPDHIENVEILASGPTSFALTGEAGGAFERPFTAMGNPLLAWDADGQILTASRRTARSAVGVRAEIPSLQYYDLLWSPVAINTVPLGAQLSLSAKGRIGNTGVRDLGAITVKRTKVNGISDRADISAHLSPLGVTTHSVKIYNGGSLVLSGIIPGSYIGNVTQWPRAGGNAVSPNNGGPSFRLRWGNVVQFFLANGAVVNGTEIHIMPLNMNIPLQSVNEVATYVVGLNNLQIVNEVASGLVATSTGEEPVAEQPFRLYQNYPNPFDQRTVFKFDLFSAAHVELEVFNILGEKVAAIVSDEMEPGTHEVEWTRNAALQSGAYIYRLKVHPLNTDRMFEMQRQLIILD